MTLNDVPLFKMFPLGDAAIVLQFGEEISLSIHNKVKAVAAHLDKYPFWGMIEYVPAFTTVTIYYNPWVISEKGNYNPYEKVVDIVLDLMTHVEEEEGLAPRVVDIPVCYGGEFGPDLEFVATQNQLTPEEVISIHAGAEYLVYMIGFAPGFPYLGGMSHKISAPRKETPRTVIPKGSVGIAGVQTGVYPIETPGGWQLIGRTPLRLFNPFLDSPSLLKAGDTVRFVPISKEEFNERKEQVYEH
ncbi:5-oxoprolinase subunit PxpB [Pontibacter silvestris]|uniref:5-oxoprolinase subunit PxpB n=1 Tax=Pontibacter silvestris TaxID=2305183 RepID=A0ABW4WYK3_9BACT|nr:5-oxoprolinase subunit PxpB [Pontibacter silvestris]MCC9135622.1 5-oxoprolinase subunit PxpB [Pontibacter silvestris]